MSSFFVVVILLLSPQPFELSPKRSCTDWFNVGRFMRSAVCLEKQLQEGLPAGASVQERIVFGRKLRNTAIAYTRAFRKAKKGKHTRVRLGKQHYALGKAIALWGRYLDDRLYENERRKQWAERIQLRLLKSRVLIPLTIITNDTSAKIELRSYKRTRKKLGFFSKNVSPGTYIIRVEYPRLPSAGKQKTVSSKSLVLRKEIHLVKGTPRVENFHRPKIAKVLARKAPQPKVIPPPQKTRSLQLSPWWFVGSGVLLGVVGGVIYGLGRNAINKRDDLYDALKSNEQKTAADTNKINQLERQGRVMMPLGVSGWLASGGLLLFAGALALTSSHKAPSPPSAKHKIKRASVGKSSLNGAPRHPDPDGLEGFFCTSN